MRPLREDEEWARQLIEADVGHSVHQHDDNSAPGMYDLWIEMGAERVAVLMLTGGAS